MAPSSDAEANILSSISNKNLAPLTRKVKVSEGTYTSVFCFAPAYDGDDDDDGLDICLKTRLLGHYIIQSMGYCSKLPHLVNTSWL